MLKVTDQFTGNVNEIRIYSFSISREITFKAFLTDFNDQYTTNWNNTEIYGRMDPIYTYKNTIRKITLGFDVPNFDAEEAKTNAENADKLIRALYPVYETNAGLGTEIISSPPLFKIKFANLITNVAKSEDETANVTAQEGGLMGWIDSYGFKPELDSGFFIEEGKIFPKLFKVNFNFNVIHEHPLGMSLEANSKSTRPSFNIFSHNYGKDNLETQVAPPVEQTVASPSNSQQESRRNFVERVPETAPQTQTQLGPVSPEPDYFPLSFGE